VFEFEGLSNLRNTPFTFGAPVSSRAICAMNLHRALRILAVLIGGVYLSGCAAPGSSVTIVSVRGTLRSDSGQPLAHTSGEIVLTARQGPDHGLDDFDPGAALSSVAGGQGNVDKFSFTTDADGSFEQELDGEIHDASCWIFPPIGCFPRNIEPLAPPFVLLRTQAAPNEMYAIQTSDGRFLIFGSDGQKLPPEQARLSHLSAHAVLEKEGTRTIGVIDIEIRTGGR
jgi:hypothetical protein